MPSQPRSLCPVLASHVDVVDCVPQLSLTETLDLALFTEREFVVVTDEDDLVVVCRSHLEMLCRAELAVRLRDYRRWLLTAPKVTRLCVAEVADRPVAEVSLLPADRLPTPEPDRRRDRRHVEGLVLDDDALLDRDLVTFRIYFVLDSGDYPLLRRPVRVVALLIAHLPPLPACELTVRVVGTDLRRLVVAVDHPASDLRLRADRHRED